MGSVGCTRIFLPFPPLFERLVLLPNIFVELLFNGLPAILLKYTLLSRRVFGLQPLENDLRPVFARLVCSLFPLLGPVERRGNLYIFKGGEDGQSLKIGRLLLVVEFSSDRINKQCVLALGAFNFYL